MIEFIIGIMLGWLSYGIVLQIAYRRGIVEYRGSKQCTSNITSTNKGE